MWEIDIPKADLVLNNKIAADFYWLEELLYNSDINENREQISKLITVILNHWDNIKDLWLRHDYNNAIMFLWQMQMSIDKIIEPINNCIENFNYAKNSVAEILNIKSSYNINDIKNIILELSFINDITIDLVILDWYFNENNALTVEKWDITNKADYLFTWDNFKNIYPDIQLEARRIFQNLIKNSKEAWANRLTITFWMLIWSWRLLMKYIDNWAWMSFDIMKDTLFIQWESTKWNSWTNIWEWMHGLARWFDERNVELDIYSVSLNNWYVWAWFTKWVFSDIVEWKEELLWLIETTKTWYYNEDFPHETWTEFVLKFPK